MTTKRVNRDTIHVAAQDSFYTPAMRRWLGNYQPVVAAEMLKGYNPRERSAQVSEQRERAMAGGEEWARGTIPGMKAVDFPALGKTMRIRKSSGLG